MKIVQFGLRYSPNVGDGIISDCLAHACRNLHPGCEVSTVDLSGRRDFGQQTMRNRDLALRVLRTLPRMVRQRIVTGRLNAMLDRVEPDWMAAADGADLAILGGGQIFSDADLNFCVKIARAAGVLHCKQVPVVIHAAGVSRNWSARGSALFHEVFRTNLRAVGLRDEPSVSAWRDQVHNEPPAPLVTRDPGLLAAGCYGRAQSSTGRVGLCVTTPEILTYHADSAVAGVTANGIGFFADVTNALIQKGERVTLFCNGAHEDRAALHQLAARPEIAAHIASGSVVVAPAPLTPADLAAIISGCRAIIAHRLHACIVAYAYEIPIVGLGWDRKVSSFFASVQSDRFFVGSPDASADVVADLAQEAVQSGINPIQHAKAVDETLRAVAGALAVVS